MSTRVRSSITQGLIFQTHQYLGRHTYDKNRNCTFIDTQMFTSNITMFIEDLTRVLMFY